MAVAVPNPPLLPEALSREQRFLVNGVSWKDYVVLREVLDTPGLRMTYCEGALELMSSSRRHELIKKSIARLVELYAFLENLPLVGYGSTTFRNEAKERGVEPDECYRVGSLMRDGEIPDIALEVIHTSPLLDKLHVYSGLGVPELWLFKDGVFELYHLQQGSYEAIPASRFLPKLDFVKLAELASAEDQPAALRQLRDSLSAQGGA